MGCPISPLKGRLRPENLPPGTQHVQVNSVTAINIKRILFDVDFTLMRLGKDAVVDGVSGWMVKRNFTGLVWNETQTWLDVRVARVKQQQKMLGTQGSWRN